MTERKPPKPGSGPALIAEFADYAKTVRPDLAGQVNVGALASWFSRWKREGASPEKIAGVMSAFFSDTEQVSRAGQGTTLWRSFIAYFNANQNVEPPKNPVVKRVRPEPKIRAIETRYAGCRFRSRTEARWAVFFTALGLRWEHEPEGYDLLNGWYLPDFLLPDLGIYVEVKHSDHTGLDPRWRDLARASGKDVFIGRGSPWPCDDCSIDNLVTATGPAHAHFEGFFTSPKNFGGAYEAARSERFGT